MADTKKWVYDARSTQDLITVMTTVRNMSFDGVIIDHRVSDDFHLPKRMRLIVAIEDNAQLVDMPKGAMVLSRHEEMLQYAASQGHDTALEITVCDEASMQAAAGHKDHPWINHLYVRLKDKTNIPLELILAEYQRGQISVFKVVCNPDDAQVAFGVMESGCQGVVVQGKTLEELFFYDTLMQSSRGMRMELLPLCVTKVSHVGLGRRLCLDTTDIMTQDEGMIVGSTSQGGLLVSSETHYLPYMQLREFRVNAGAVHSYVWAPERRTAYLSDLRAGSKVLCVNTQGHTREVTIGRIKSERRPLLMIEAADEAGNPINTIVQDDWHIRLFDAQGQPVNASDIAPGTRLLGAISKKGRHVGINIDETIDEY